MWVETLVLGWRLARSAESWEQVGLDVGSCAEVVEAGRDCHCCDRVDGSACWFDKSSRCMSWTDVASWEGVGASLHADGWW